MNNSELTRAATVKPTTSILPSSCLWGSQGEELEVTGAVCRGQISFFQGLKWRTRGHGSCV